MASLLDFFETRRPAAKRRKLSYEDNKDSSSFPKSNGVNSLHTKNAIDSRSKTESAEPVDLAVGNEDIDIPRSSQTELEISLPPVKTDQDAIAEYENSRAAEADEEQLSLQQRLGEMKWRKGKSSIYVDAFNLALETVLNEEAHLFDDSELDVFRIWNEMNYEAQYLLVYPGFTLAYSYRNEIRKLINDLHFPDMYDFFSARPPLGIA